MLLSPSGSGIRDEVSIAGDELEVAKSFPFACRFFCSACMDEERSASAEAMLRVFGERNAASDDPALGATAGGLSRFPAV